MGHVGAATFLLPHRRWLCCGRCPVLLFAGGQPGTCWVHCANQPAVLAASVLKLQICAVLEDHELHGLDMEEWKREASPSHHRGQMELHHGALGAPLPTLIRSKIAVQEAQKVGAVGALPKLASIRPSLQAEGRCSLWTAVSARKEAPEREHLEDPSENGVLQRPCGSSHHSVAPGPGGPLWFLGTCWR